MCEKERGELTIHGLSLHDVVAFIFGEEEFEVSFGILDVSDLIFIIDKVAGDVSIEPG